MSAGFQARLDEMLRSRQAQLQRLNEETSLQDDKRLALEERKAELRRIQRRTMALNLGLDKLELHTALSQEEVRRLQAQEEKLVREQREVALETCGLQQQARKSTENEAPCIPESVEELRKAAGELELVLKRLGCEVSEATRREEYLAGLKREVQGQVRENEWIKRGVEKEVSVARERMRAKQRLQDEVKALQLDNQSLEKQLLAALQE